MIRSSLASKIVGRRVADLILSVPQQEQALMMAEVLSQFGDVMLEKSGAIDDWLLQCHALRGVRAAARRKGRVRLQGTAFALRLRRLIRAHVPWKATVPAPPDRHSHLSN